jgi:hypothetical protein
LRKIIATLLLAMIFTSQIGYYIIYSIQQYIIREEIEKEFLRGLPDSAFEVIIAEQYKDKLEWEEEGREFSLNGSMYDVARIKKINGFTYLFCLNDKKEKRLLDKLANAAGSANENNSNNRPGQHHVKYQFSDFVVYKNDMELSRFAFIKPEYINFNVALPSAFKKVSSPPPQV